MAHIHTNPGDYDHTTSAFIVNTSKKEPRVLFHMHKKLNVYVQIGGHIEVNEDPWESIKHEILEESGYKMSQLKILQPPKRLASMSDGKLHPSPIYHYSHRFNDGHFHTDVSYAFVTSQSPAGKVGKGESNDLVFLTRSELVALPQNQTIESVREAGLFVFDTCLTEWEALDTTIFD